MYCVYILRNNDAKIYIGYTSDLKSRIQRHNQGKEKATKYGIPWKLIYFEAYISSKLALNRERKLKHYGKSLSMLKKRIGF